MKTLTNLNTLTLSNLSIFPPVKLQFQVCTHICSLPFAVLVLLHFHDVRTKQSLQAVKIFRFLVRCFNLNHFITSFFFLRFQADCGTIFLRVDCTTAANNTYRVSKKINCTLRPCVYARSLSFAFSIAKKNIKSVKSSAFSGS